MPDYLRRVDDEPAEEQEADDTEQDVADEIPEPTPLKGGFQVVSMSLFSRADEPAMILIGHAFRFNVNCIKRMGGTTHVELLMNPLEHLLAIRPCAPDHPNSIALQPKPYSAKSLCGLIFTLMDWDTDYRYYMPAILRKRGNERIMFFDMDEPSVYERKQNGRRTLAQADSVNIAGVFGTLLAEHVSETRIPAIDHGGQWDIRKEGRIAEDVSAISSDTLGTAARDLINTEQKGAQ